MIVSLVILILSSVIFALLSQPSWLNIGILLSEGLNSDLKTPNAARILLLTAHPDDECMFFAPTVLALTAPDSIHSGIRDAELFSLCLSIGDADGLGDVRRKELGYSLDVLGIKEGNRWIEDRPDLKDNLTMQWDSQTIADVVKSYVLEHHITTILTFDHHGISGHPNHVSLLYGAAHLISSLASAPSGDVVPPRLFTLVSVPLLEKYTGAFAPLSVKAKDMFAMLMRATNFQTPALAQDALRFYNNTAVFASSATEYKTALRAMLQHRSQLVWFRWLYVAFSRYMWVNEWVEVVPPSATSWEPEAPSPT